MATMTLAASPQRGPAHGARRRPQGACCIGEDIGTARRRVPRDRRAAGASSAPTASMDTPLAEAGIMGIAVGLAYRGYRPVVRDPVRRVRLPGVRPDRHPGGEDALPHRAATCACRSRSACRTAAASARSSTTPSRPRPTSRTPPGLRVVTCVEPAGRHMMIRQAIACDDPVVFFEPKRRYCVKGEVDEPSSPTRRRMDRARVVARAPTSRSSTYGPLVVTARDAAIAAAGRGLSIEVDGPALALAGRLRHGRGVRPQDRPARRHARGRPAAAGSARRSPRAITERCFDVPRGRARARHRASTPRTRRRSSRSTSCPTSTASSTPSTAYGPTELADRMEA